MDWFLYDNGFRHEKVKIWYQHSLHDSHLIYINIFQMPRSLMTPETKLGNSIFENVKT